MSQMPEGRPFTPLWCRESVLAALRAFADEHGRPPQCKDTKSADGKLPSYMTVTRLFGSWADGVEAAGLRRPIRGGTDRAYKAPLDAREAAYQQQHERRLRRQAARTRRRKLAVRSFQDIVDRHGLSVEDATWLRDTFARLSSEDLRLLRHLPEFGDLEAAA